MSDVLVDDAIAMAEGVLAGTHEGEFNGASPTGRGLELPFMETYRFDDEGIAEHRVYYDPGEFARQLGLDGE